MRRAGFTLVELMIVVAIIGLLAAIAIPNYLTFQCKSKQSQAKSGLGGWFISEKTFFSEFSTYGTDLLEVHWEPEGSPLYLFGFGSAQYPSAIDGIVGWTPSRNTTAHSGVIGNPARYNTAKMVNLTGSPLAPSQLPVTACGGQTFILGAVADIDPRSGVDQWQMDQLRQLVSPANDCI